MRDFLTRPVGSPWAPLAAAALITNALIHIDLTPMHRVTAPYLGFLFFALAAACIVLAAALFVRDAAAVWAAAWVVNVSALLGFLASRTVGLPLIGEEVGDWSGLAAWETLLVEVLVIALATDALQVWNAQRRAFSGRTEKVFPPAGKNRTAAGHQ